MSTYPDSPTRVRRTRQLVRDRRDGRIGEVMQHREIGGTEKYWLRPIGGGLEWTANADDVIDWLDEITGAAEQWLRRCNGQPAEGKPVSRRGLRIVLASSGGIAVRPDGVIVWRGDAGEFTAEPVDQSATKQ